MLLVCLFLLQRIGLLIYGYPHIAHPGFDETASGVLACDLLDGSIRAPLSVYQYEGRSGDSLIEGFLLVPFFSLFGRFLFSLKALALTSAFLCMLCWIILLKRYHGVWASIIYAALFAFPPPLFARLTLLGTIASHHLINPIISLQLLLLFLIIEGDRGKVSLWLWAGMGLLAGLGTYTFYTYIIFNLFCALFLLLFRFPLITATPLLLFGGGFLAGFSPWIAAVLSSGGGGDYLLSILEHIRVDRLVLVRNFLFTFPHSLGYSYPSQRIGVVSILFSLFTLFLGGGLLINFFRHLRSLWMDSWSSALRNLKPSFLLGIFVVLFPLFFLLVLSLSPLDIKPFEYWPAVGFFGHFSGADPYRYRWLTSLYPFYLVIIAVGMVSLATATRSRPSLRYAACAGLVFFLLCGALKSVELCSGGYGYRVYAYKGFSYDQMGNRFMLRPGAEFSPQWARQLISEYPEENRAELYKFLGARIMREIVEHSGSEKELEHVFQEIPPAHTQDLLYGIIWAAQEIPEEIFQPFARYLSDSFQGSFYENWGYRYLGYKYYLLLLNWGKIQSYIPPEEWWFYKGFLNAFWENMQGKPREELEKSFFKEMEIVPPEYRSQTVKGIGMRVGAEMLFNPVYSADYPLDSRFGENFEHTLREAFYEGVGAGFAEMLCRLWRTLLLPEVQTSPLYKQRLDLEWERCQNLMALVSPPYADVIGRGFVGALRQSSLSVGIEHYISKHYENRRTEERGQ